ASHKTLHMVNVILRQALSGFGPTKTGKANAPTVQADLANHVAAIDVAAIFKKSADLFTSIIASADYESALRFYNCKGIPSFVAGALGVNTRTYCNMIIGITRSPEGARVAADLRSKVV
ncbi:MAG: hypothetical protein P4L56_08130, partial [Candidatus Sulfopaludibacter sp.]|nr:hypothetical protein [Candidatus Sulfopaludibacter sp.]